MRAGRLDTPADLIEMSPDLTVCKLDWLWCDIQTKDGGDVPAAGGLRNPAKVTIRAWWDARLLAGRYLVARDRLFLIDSARDFTGTQAEIVITATELVGQLGEYRPAEGVPVPCRVHLTHEAPYRDDLGQVTEYKTRAEVAVIEVGRPQADDQLMVSGTLYTVISYADETDDGVVRGLWLEKV